MDKSIVCLLGAVGALAATNPARAAVTAAPLADALRATSYSDLLKPIPNAVALMKQAAAADADTLAAHTLAREPEATLQDAQVIVLQRHHHHHHHRYYRRHRHYRYHHHHHHHHHQS